VRLVDPNLRAAGEEGSSATRLDEEIRRTRIEPDGTADTEQRPIDTIDRARSALQFDADTGAAIERPAQAKS